MRKQCTGFEWVCSNKAAPGRRLCHACYSRRVKKFNPFFYFFNAERNNARRRNISFELTLQEFKEFAIETDYIRKKGTSSKSLTIDRIRDEIGYRKDNIQIQTNRSNVKKARLRYVPEVFGFRVHKVTDWSNAPPIPPGCPF